MESYTSYSQSSSGSFWNFDALKNFDEIFPIFQSHLKQVYFTLCCVIVASTVGSYLHTLWNIGGLLTALACLGCMACLLSTPPSEEIKKFMLLMATAALEGTSIGSLVDLVIQIEYSILLTVFVGCAIAFGCFSVATMFAKRREFLYLGALLSSGISMLFLLQFASSIFESSAFLFKFELYFGLLVLLGYIVFDDVKHALTLSIDFIAVFVRRLIIMVYFTLCCVIVASTVGSYLHTLWNIGGLLTALACLGCMACLLSTPPSEEIKRLILLMATAAPEGTSIVPLVNLVIQIDYSILLTAFVGCAIAFGCFSVATMFAKRWEFLYLGALLSSGISILFWLQFASSIFGGGAFLFKFELNNSMEKNEKYKRD